MAIHWACEGTLGSSLGPLWLGDPDFPTPKIGDFPCTSPTPRMWFPKPTGLLSWLNCSRLFRFARLEELLAADILEAWLVFVEGIMFQVGLTGYQKNTTVLDPPPF